MPEGLSLPVAALGIRPAGMVSEDGIVDQPMPLAVVSRSYDAEGADFADDLAAAFTNAKWQADRQKDWLMSNKGLALATLEGTTIPPSLAIALIDALRNVNLEATVTIIESERQSVSANFQPNILYLLVGAKP